MDSDTPALLDLDDPVELLAYLPYRLGFWPEHSAVFFALRRAGHAWEPGVVARVDLDDLAAAAGLRAQLLAHLRNDEAVVVFLVLYTLEPLTEGVDAHGSAAQVARWWLTEGIGAALDRVWVVCGETYRCLECTEEPCCPAVGHPLARTEQSRISAEMVFSGQSFVPSRSDLLCLPEVSSQVRNTAVRAAARWRRTASASGASLDRWRRTAARRWDRALVRAGAGNVPTGADLGVLLVGLEDVRVRDAVLLSVVAEMSVCDALVDHGGELLDRVFSPQASRPSSAAMQAANDLILHIVSASARGRAASPWAVLAWLSWFSGNGAQADVCVARCLRDDPDHRLGQLLRRAVEHGIPPGWARARSAA